MNDGVVFIAQERARQIELEGWDFQNDDKYTENELSKAAGCYALPVGCRGKFSTYGIHAGYGKLPQYWPWDESWWKPSPKNRIKELSKAGALIAAEIDRLIRIGECQI